MNLKFLRNKKNLTQEEIAIKLNLTQNTYSNYETGKTQPDIELLKKIASFFNVSLDYLCDYNFNNSIGYLSDDEKEVINLFKKLTSAQLNKVHGYILGLLEQDFSYKTTEK